MSYIDPTATGAATTASSTSQGGGVNQLDNSQTFLKLLVAQLKNQNPDNPTDPTAFMTEIAQLTAVQSQTSLNAEEQTVAADSMIGRDVSGAGAGGTKVSGTVTGVVLSSSGAPQLEVSVPGATSPTSIALDAVTRVYQAASPAPSSTSSSTSTNTVA